jgi:hypothetical protein
MKAARLDGSQIGSSAGGDARLRPIVIVELTEITVRHAGHRSCVSIWLREHDVQLPSSQVQGAPTE